MGNTAALSPRSITHVVRQFHPAIGGFEDVVLNLAHAQRERFGIDARVVTLDSLFADRHKRLPPQGTVDGVPVTRLPWSGSSRYPLAPGVLRQLGDSDIVHVHAIDFFFDYLALTRPLHRRRLVASTHGGFFHTRHRARLKRVWFGTVTRAAVRAYDAIIAVSQADAEMFAPLAASRMVTIDNGVNLAKFLPRSGIARDSRRIITFGRQTRHKQIDRLIALLAALRRQDARWNLVIAGPAGDHPVDELRQAALAVGVADAVRVEGGLTDALLSDEVAQAGWYGSASSYEGFGLAAVEACAAGLMPVLNRIPPFERLRAKLGLGVLFDAGAPEQAVGEMMAQADVLDGDGAALRCRLANAVKGYGLDTAVAAHMRLYGAIMTQPVDLRDAMARPA